MRKILLMAIIFIFSIIASAQAQKISDFPATLKQNIANPLSYNLFLDYKPQGFFTTYSSAYQAAQTEIKRKSCSVIQITADGKQTFFLKQYKLNRVTYLPWQIEIAPGCKALHLDMSWEGDAEIVLIDPSGKLITQSAFGTTYPNILSYYAHEGEDLLLLNPPTGIWQVWVLGKFKNAQINVPHFYNLYQANFKVSKKNPFLTFGTYWENKFLEDVSPAKLFLADEKGQLYLMQANNKKILSELTGYNGLAMEISNPHLGTWKLIALTTTPKINQLRFMTFSHLLNIVGEITALKYDKKTHNYLFYWKATPHTTFPKLLFLSANPLYSDNIGNLIVPLTKNPQAVPAAKLPNAFNYKYYISSPFGMGDDGLLNGPQLRIK